MCRSLASTVSFLLVVVVAGGCRDSSSPEQRHGPPAELTVASGDGQSGIAGDVLAHRISAKVTDAQGRGVPNVTVEFAPLPNSGTVTASVMTDASGVAAASWHLPTTAGVPAAVRASLVDPASGATLDTVRFTATVVGGPPTSIEATTALLRGATGAPYPLAVHLRDRYGNPSPDVTVAWTVTDGGGKASDATSISDGNGIASMTVTLGTAPGFNHVQATTGGLAARFAVEGIVAGQPVLLVRSPAVSHAPLGSTIPISVGLLDGLEHGVPNQPIQWEVVGGGGTVSTQTSFTDADGIARVQFTLNATPILNTLKAHFGTLTAEFAIDGRLTAARLTTLSEAGYGIALARGDLFVVSEREADKVVTFHKATPELKQTIAVGTEPDMVAVDDAGAFAYVTHSGGWVDVIDLSTSSLAGTIAVPGAHTLAFAPGGGRLYVTGYAGQVYAVNTTTRTVVDSVALTNNPLGIAFRTEGSDTLMYIGSQNGNRVAEVDTRTMSVLRTFTGIGSPHGMAISRDQGTLYIANDSYDFGQVMAIDVATGVQVASVAIPGALDLRISPDGTTLFVTAGYGKFAVIDARAMTITRKYETDGIPDQVAVAPDGTIAYAADLYRWVDAIAK